MIIHGDCLEVLKTMASNSVDAIVTDPPYGLRFMAKKWDYDVPSVDVWRECLRVLKPGGHMLVACGTRTQHRMVAPIEDAGFEIRDVVTWIYGQGFPKSLDVSKAIDKEAGAEREVVGERRKLQSYGSGVNEVYGGAPEKGGVQQITAPATDAAREWEGWGTALKPACEFWTLCRKPLSESTVAKNVLRWGTGGLNIDGCRVESGSDYHDLQVTQGGNRSMEFGMKERQFAPASGRFPANLLLDEEAAQALDAQSGIGASRFFYVAKASKADRGQGNTHPTVKPTALMAYLCRLITQPGGLVLDPFAGSGSTGVGALKDRFRFVGVEREEQYVEIANRRCAYVS